jgi:hypothetical protein
MLKKLFGTISVIIYFAVTAGIVVNLHYCMSRFDSARLYTTGTDICGKCGMHTEDSDGCCHDELKVIKLNEDHHFSSFIFELRSPETVPSNYHNLPAEIITESARQKDYLNHSPPLLSQQDSYLQNCVFRI